MLSRKQCVHATMMQITRPINTTSPAALPIHQPLAIYLCPRGTKYLSSFLLGCISRNFPINTPPPTPLSLTLTIYSQLFCQGEGMFPLLCLLIHAHKERMGGKLLPRTDLHPSSAVVTYGSSNQSDNPGQLNLFQVRRLEGNSIVPLVFGSGGGKKKGIRYLHVVFVHDP